MTFEVTGSINTIADKIIRIPGIETIMGNPMYTALLITVIVLLITMFIFRDATTDESLFKVCLRGGFYTFIILIGVIFLHNRVLMSENSHVRLGSDIDGVFSPRNGAYTSDDLIPVSINVDFTK